MSNNFKSGSAWTPDLTTEAGVAEAIAILGAPVVLELLRLEHLTLTSDLHKTLEEMRIAHIDVKTKIVTVFPKKDKIDE